MHFEYMFKYDRCDQCLILRNHHPKSIQPSVQPATSIHFHHQDPPLMDQEATCFFLQLPPFLVKVSELLGDGAFGRVLKARDLQEDTVPRGIE